MQEHWEKVTSRGATRGKNATQPSAAAKQLSDQTFAFRYVNVHALLDNKRLHWYLFLWWQTKIKDPSLTESKRSRDGTSTDRSESSSPHVSSLRDFILFESLENQL